MKILDVVQFSASHVELQIKRISNPALTNHSNRLLRYAALHFTRMLRQSQ